MRQPNDFYETPPHYLDALFSIQRLPPRSLILEPCAGDGAIVDYLRARKHSVNTNDLDKARGAHMCLDATKDELWENWGSEWAITNPPFDQINEITAIALAYARNYITLARLSFLEPTSTFRKSMYRIYGPPMLVIVLPRYQFTEPATDTMTCCWLGWGPDVTRTFKIWTE